MDNAHENLLESLKRDIAFTSGNYGQMHDRLILRDWVSRIAIVYYSLVTIGYAVLSVCFTVSNEGLLNFVSICVSVITLVASLMISFARYSERATKVMQALDRIKRIKKELVKYSFADLCKDDYTLYDKFVEKYHAIVDEVELRADVDYYRTCKTLKSNPHYADAWNRLSWFQKAIAYLSRALEYVFYAFLAVAPFFPLPFFL